MATRATSGVTSGRAFKRLLRDLTLLFKRIVHCSWSWGSIACATTTKTGRKQNHPDQDSLLTRAPQHLPTRHPNDNQEGKPTSLSRARDGGPREHNNAAGTHDDRGTANFVSIEREKEVTYPPRRSEPKSRRGRGSTDIEVAEPNSEYSRRGRMSETENHVLQYYYCWRRWR